MYKQLVRRAALAVGFHVGRFPSRDSLQGHLKEFFQRMAVNCVFDVGAHDGEFATAIRDIGYRGRIVSFEPVSGSFENISRKASRSTSWIVRNWALGSEETEKEINVYRGAVFNSFLSSSEFGGERFGDQLEQASKEKVRVRRLDQVFGECTANIDEPRCFLKMDTQGWDLEVMKGAAGVMSSIVGIQSELAVKHCYEGMVGFTRALEQYAALGFEVTGMYPVAYDHDQLRVLEFDCVMLKASATGS